MKKALKILGAILGILVLVAAGLYFQDHRFWHRYYLVVSTGGTLPQEGWAGSEYYFDGANHEYLPVSDTSKWTIDPQAIDAAKTWASERNSSSLLIWHEGELLVREHFGDYDEKTLIVGKSMAKMVVSAVVGRAIKEGYIASLDEPAATYITEWQGTEKDTVSIRHMLHMSAGFEPFYTPSNSPFSKFLRSYLEGHNEDYLIDGYDLIDEPGTVYDYSQVVSDLLGMILERATGMPYGEYLDRSLIKPIGAQGGEVMMNRPNGLAHTGCCLLLPSESWLRIGLFLLDGGIVNGEALLPDGWMDEYLTPSPANPAMGMHIWLGEPYLERRSWQEVGEPSGFGIFHSEPYLASDLFLFDGSGHQVMYMVPSEQLVVLRTGSWSWSPEKEWDNAYLPNTLIRGIKNSAAAETEAGLE